MRHQHREGYEVKRSGDATVILLGFPSTGKSTLLNALTDAQSEVGAYAFTTLTVVPGMLKHKHARIQILDVPGIVQGASSGKGRGKEVLASMRSADMAFIVVDATRPEELPVIRREVYDTRIRLDEDEPDVRIRKKAKDGVRIGRTVATPLLDNYAMLLSEPDTQGSIASVRGIGWQLGQTIGLFLSGIVQSHIGFPPLFLATGFLYTLAIFLTWIYFRPEEKN